MPSVCTLPRIARAVDCAVVGSSDALRILPMGREIDQHATIWRVNNAPTAGFEALAGSRTDLRLVNNVAVDVWADPAKLAKEAQKAEGAGRFQAHEFDPLELCGGNTSCLLTDYEDSRKLVLAKARQAHPEITLRPLGFKPKLKACYRGGTRLSTGFVTVLLALSSCSGVVHLYGFMPYCCKGGKEGWPAMNYKYFHNNKSQYVCCSGYRENMGFEFEEMRSYERLGRVVMHPTRGTYPKPRWQKQYRTSEKHSKTRVFGSDQKH